MASPVDDMKKDPRVLSAYRSLLRISRNTCSAPELRNVRKAFRMALDACPGRPAILGQPPIFHATGVARIVAREEGMGSNSVISALLFDFTGESGISESDLRENFNESIQRIVNGLVQIAGIDTQKSSDQGDNLRSLLISLSGDIRVIIIKIADRLYFMRNLYRLDRGEQLRVANETFHVYAPLAHRLGLYDIKSELEDLSFKCTNPKVCNYLINKLRETRSSRERFIREFIRPLKEELIKQHPLIDIKGRTKSVYSIWSKMKRQNVGFEEVYDVFAIRIIIKSKPESEKADCWHVYSVVTDIYQPNPDRLRDWISIPKSNGYESLHTTVIVPGGRWVEVQIRTERMNEIAEKGLAAHWKYKGIKTGSAPDKWLDRIREVFEHPGQTSKEVIDNFKRGISDEEVFAFTPKGDLKKLPAGSTVLDFAFDVHTEVGFQCAGAKVNGRNVPIRHVLRNGDKVEILTSKSQSPKQDWLNYVTSPKARSKIKLSLKEQMLSEAETGREILKRRFRNWKIGFEDRIINKLLRHYRLQTAPDLYYRIAKGRIDILEIREILAEPKTQVRSTEQDNLEAAVERIISPGIRQDDFLLIGDQLDNVNYKLAKCCLPIHGDEIFGFVTVNSVITIHRVNCPNARQLISRYGYRLVKAQWSGRDSNIHLPATIRITGIDDIGILSRVSDAISNDLRVNMRSVSVKSDEGMFEGTITLFVKDTGHLDVLINKISKIKGVLSAKRLEL